MIQRSQPGKRLLDLVCQETRFAFFRSEVDFEQDLLTHSDRCSPSIYFSRQFHTVDGMDQFEHAHHGAGFSPLKLPDEMPSQALALERLNFGKGVLEPVFTGDLHSC